MFVAKDHIVLKTCGKTKLLNCVEPLLELTQVYLGIGSIQVRNLFAIFYTITIYVTCPCTCIGFVVGSFMERRKENCVRKAQKLSGCISLVIVVTQLESTSFDGSQSVACQFLWVFCLISSLCSLHVVACNVIT